MYKVNKLVEESKLELSIECHMQLRIQALFTRQKEHQNCLNKDYLTIEITKLTLGGFLAKYTKDKSLSHKIDEIALANAQSSMTSTIHRNWEVKRPLMKMKYPIFINLILQTGVYIQ